MSGYEFADNTEQSVFLFLDELRKSGACNMFEAGNYVRDNYPELEKRKVQDLVVKWMKTFGERNQ